MPLPVGRQPNAVHDPTLGVDARTEEVTGSSFSFLDVGVVLLAVMLTAFAVLGLVALRRRRNGRGF